MGFGGGAMKSKGEEKVNGIKVTTYPHRDAVWNFVYDLFYEPGAGELAASLQSEMQDIVDKYLNTDNQEKRLFWGTFGNAEDTDMSKEKVQKMFYDDATQYKDLQGIKKQYDPSDLFHTELTIQLPK